MQAKPQYYGFWMTPEKINSIFFMYLTWMNSEDNKFGGTIDDKFGNAKFDGRITQKEIIFNKTYIGSSSPIAAKSPLEYKGTHIKNFKDSYEGVYTGKDEDGNYISGTFILQPFPRSSKTTNSLLNDFLEKRNR